MTRVIAGVFRGRRLHGVPRGRTTVRPTSDRTKTVLFDLLGPLAGVETVLDLYAGTGSLGIEALSRGADRAVFVERDRAAIRVLERNLESLDLEGQTRVVREDALAFLSETPDTWPLILADPPYETGAPVEVLSRLHERELVTVGGRVVIEHGSREALPERVGDLALIRCRPLGDTALSIFRAESAPPASEGEPG